MAYTSINKPTDYFNTKLYSGSVSSQSITGVGFQPDWVWIKYRSDIANHHLYDSVRGVQKRLNSNTTNTEATSVNNLTSFDSDGFTIGTENDINESGQTYASWNWLASNSTASNTDGSITSTVSANTTSGFSIVSYTGTGSNATVGHGLGAIPKIVIIKNRDRASGWHVGGDAIGSVNQYLNLNDTNAIDSATTGFKSFSSTTFGIGSDTDWNASSESIIAYCFAEKKGFSKFGSYTGNGSTDGPMVYTGFKPAWIMIKRTDSTHNWSIIDSIRSINDGSMEFLLADTNSAEDTDPFYDIVSNGFKLRDTALRVNASGGSYIYLAFAESPFTTSTGVPTTAR